MAGIGMESPDKKELDERALPAEPSDNSSRPHRERRKPDRYGSLAPEGSISSKPKSLPHHSQAADPFPTTTAGATANNLEHPDPQPEKGRRNHPQLGPARIGGRGAISSKSSSTLRGRAETRLI